MGTGSSCHVASGIFQDQGSNKRFPHWQVDSLPLSHQESITYHVDSEPACGSVKVRSGLIWCKQSSRRCGEGLVETEYLTQF